MAARDVPDRRRPLGIAAEMAAAEYLERGGMRVVERNVRFREGEIDLVCREGGTWVFVEVKCRRARWGDGPAEAVSWWKRRRLTRLAIHYLKWRHLGEPRCRFDVVAVTIGDDGALGVRHLPAAFDATP
jgi:putative endonuclease